MSCDVRPGESLSQSWSCWPGETRSSIIFAPGDSWGDLPLRTKKSSNTPRLLTHWSLSGPLIASLVILSRGSTAIVPSHNEPIHEPVEAFLRTFHLALARVLSRAGGDLLGLWLSGIVGSRSGHRLLEPGA